MKWNRLTLPCPRFAASQKSRRLPISGSASRSLRAWACQSLSSGGAASMTALTLMRGWTNISAEDGPGRRFHGP